MQCLPLSPLLLGAVALYIAMAIAQRSTMHAALVMYRTCHATLTPLLSKVYGAYYQLWLAASSAGNAKLSAGVRPPKHWQPSKSDPLPRALALRQAGWLRADARACRPPAVRRQQPSLAL
jgi:hypothetical protein